MADCDSVDRYKGKLSLIGGLDPYKVDKVHWSVGEDVFPRVTYPDIFNYLICNLGPYTTDDLKAYKGLEAYNQFLCGWVRDVAVYVSGDLRVVSCKVLHSQRMNEAPLKPWIIARPTGEIESAHCDCMAGLGETCTHIAATLFWLEAKEKIRCSKTVTQERAYWLLPSGVKKIPYSSISKIDFTSAKTKKRRFDQALCSVTSEATGATPATKKTSVTPGPSKEELDNFYKALASGGTKPAILSVIPQYSNSFIPQSRNPKLPPVLTEQLFDEKTFELTLTELLGKCSDLFHSVCISQSEANIVEKLTRKQASSNLWFQMRAGRITASKLRATCASNPDKPSVSLIRSICHPESVRFSTQATRWSCQHEKEARQIYCDRMTVGHVNFSVTDSGLLLNPEYPHLDATPDGRVSCDCCGEGCVEIKCPFCQRSDVLNNQTVPSPQFCLENVDGKLQLKTTHMYFYQVQCQLFMNGSDYCDFVVFTEKDLHVERIVPNVPFWEEILAKATQFYIKAVMPELVGKFYSRKSTSKVSKTCAAVPNIVSTDKDLFCYCQRPESGKMIACDNQNCKWQWFHFKCLQMKAAPCGNWFCPDSKKS